jgi:hypothetical protein
MKPLNEKALDAVTDTANSTEIKSDFQVACSVQVVTTSTIAGAVKLQFSNDPQNVAGYPVNWSDIAGATVTLSGSAGVFHIPKTEICYNYMRVVFTKSGGSGTVTANYHSFAF